MTVIDLRVNSYYSDISNSGKFKIDIGPANDEISPLGYPVYSFDCVLGSIDIPNSHFPTVDYARDYFIGNNSQDVIDYLNTVRGTSDTLGVVRYFLSKTQADAFDSKQSVIIAASHIADASTNATTGLATNYGVLTSLLQLASALNSANSAQNDLAVKYNDLGVKFNTLMDHLETQGLQTTT